MPGDSADALSPDAADKFASLNSIIITASLLVLIAIGYRINIGRIRHLPESGAAMILGFVIGGLVRVLGIMREEELLAFNGEFFFFVLLPPIIFEAGLSLETKIFVDNLGAILTFAVLGTIVSTWVVSHGLQAMTHLGMTGLADDGRLVIVCHLFGALISATDPVATIALFGGSRFRTDPLLHSLINGESVLNDAVAIVLFSTLSHHVDDEHPTILSVGVLGEFFLVSLSSVALGLAAGIIFSGVFRGCSHLTRYPDYEISAMCLGGYLTFALSQLAGLSGIVALFFFGVVLAHYNFYNLSEPSKVASKVVFRTLAMLAESCVFLYLGVVAALSFGRFHWHLGLVFVSLVLITVARAAHIFPFSWILNQQSQQRKIGRNMTIMLWFSGLRGAIAFALALRIPCNAGPPASRGESACRNSDLLVTSTISIVLVTTMVVGTAMEHVASLLGVIEVEPIGSVRDENNLEAPLARASEKQSPAEGVASGGSFSQWLPLAGESSDLRLGGLGASASAGLGALRDMRPRGHVYQAFAQLDVEFLQPWLGGPSRVRVSGGQDMELQGYVGQPTMPRRSLGVEEDDPPPRSRAVIFE